MSTPVDQHQQGFFVGNERLSLSGFFAQTPRVDLALPNIGFVAIPHFLIQKRPMSY